MHSFVKGPQPEPGQTQLLIMIPALNEERTIGDVIERIRRRIDGVGSIAVLVVDDGSSDRTGEIAAKAGATVKRHPQTRGVGAAFGTALRYGVERGCGSAGQHRRGRAIRPG